MSVHSVVRSVVGPAAVLFASAAFADTPTQISSFGRLPLTLEPNTGRYDKRVQFVTHTGGATVFITKTEAVMVLRGKASGEGRGVRSERDLRSGRPAGPSRPSRPSANHVLRMKLVGANAKAVATGLQKQPGIVNYFIGNDPKKWRTRVPTYGKARLAGVYPGVDVVYYGQEARGERQGAGVTDHSRIRVVRSQLSALSPLPSNTTSSSTPAPTRTASSSLSREPTASVSPPAI